MTDGGARARARSAATGGGGGGRRPKVAGGETGGRDAAGPMAFIMDAIRCGCAFDCVQCGELGIWQGASCESCTGMVEG